MIFFNARAIKFLNKYLGDALRIFLQRGLHKETTMVYTRSEYTTLNVLQKRLHKANEVYKPLMTTKITNTLFYNFL